MYKELANRRDCDKEPTERTVTHTEPANETVTKSQQRQGTLAHKEPANRGDSGA